MIGRRPHRALVGGEIQDRVRDLLRGRMAPERDKPIEDLGGLVARYARGAHLDVVLEPAAARTDVILTPDQRVRVFISPTLGELAAERAAARRAISRLHLVPVWYESGPGCTRRAACTGPTWSRAKTSRPDRAVGSSPRRM